MSIDNKREVYKPDDCFCGKCGSPIAFYKCKEGKAKGKWIPCNIDGEDHWDSCTENLIKGTYGKKKEFKMHEYGGNTNPQKRTKFYTGEIPPWDKSLGEFKEND